MRKSHARPIRPAPAIGRGTFGKIAAAAIVGALGVGMSVSTATAATAPQPTVPQIDLSNLDPANGLEKPRHPSTFMSKGTAAKPQAKLLAAPGPHDDFDNDGKSEVVYTDLAGYFHILDSVYNQDLFVDLELGVDTIVTPGDVDGDNRNDIIGRTPTGELRLYRNVSVTDQVTTSSYTTIGHGWQIYNRIVGAGDLTGDGRPDLLARTPSGDLYRYASLGNGQLGARVKIGYGWNIYDQIVVSGDISGDGRADVLARTPSGDLYRYASSGNGQLGARVKIGYGWQIYNQIQAGGDINGDGAADVMARTPAGQLYSYSSTGTGLSGRTTVGNGWNWALSLANMGGGVVYGKSELFARTSNGGVYYYPGNGSGGFTARQELMASGWPTELPIHHTMSMDSNPNSEFLTVDYNTKSLINIDTDAALASKWNTKTATVGLGDVTGDGRGDILARTSAGALQLYPGRGDNNLALGAPIALGNGWNIYNAIIGAGDMSGDGIADFLARTTGGELYLFKGLGNGKFAGRVKLGAGYNVYTQIAAPGDLDGDGLADIVGRDSAGKLWRMSGKAGGTLAARAQIGFGWQIYNGLF